MKTEKTKAQRMKAKKKMLMAQRLEKALELLEMPADLRRDYSVSALARTAGISRYHTIRLLERLESGKGERGPLARDGYGECGGALPGGMPPQEEGRPGHAGQVSFFSSAGDSAQTYRCLMEEVRPVMESLADRHNEAMYLTVLKGDEVFFIDMVDCRRQVRGEPLVGRRFPFFSNAAGKVMRAIDSWDLLEKIGKRWRRGQVRYPDLAGFQSELEMIRKKGVAVDCGGMGDGVVMVAVAVRDYAGKVVGALTMLGPSFRLLGARLEEEIIPSLRMSGELLSMKFGYVRP